MLGSFTTPKINSKGPCVVFEKMKGKKHVYLHRCLCLIKTYEIYICTNLYRCTTVYVVYQHIVYPSVCRRMAIFCCNWRMSPPSWSSEGGYQSTDVLEQFVSCPRGGHVIFLWHKTRPNHYIVSYIMWNHQLEFDIVSICLSWQLNVDWNFRMLQSVHINIYYNHDWYIPSKSM